MKLFFVFLFAQLICHSQTKLTLAFGSCGHQDTDLPILFEVAKLKPNYFIFLGDNIYGDSKRKSVIKKKYEQLSAIPSFQLLKTNTSVLATWDDHDFGKNDAGKEFTKKKQNKKIFLDFFKEPLTSDRWVHDGIYTSYNIELEGAKVQVILLDTRTFRDQLVRTNRKNRGTDNPEYELTYAPHKDSSKTILGTQQWAWLKGVFSQAADYRIIASSTQFGIEYNGYESWANFPAEQNRILQLIKETQAGGVIFISGDVHYGEFSELKNKESYPIFDFTSSGLTQEWSFATPNKNRIAGPMMQNNFGLIEINALEKTIEVQLRDKTGSIVAEKLLHLDALQNKP